MRPSTQIRVSTGFTTMGVPGLSMVPKRANVLETFYWEKTFNTLLPSCEITWKHVFNWREKYRNSILFNSILYFAKNLIENDVWEKMFYWENDTNFHLKLTDHLLQSNIVLIFGGNWYIILLLTRVKFALTSYGTIFGSQRKQILIDTTLTKNYFSPLW